MTYQTHKQYAILFAFIGCMILYKYQVTEINYYMTIPIMIMFSRHGALFPDVDHVWKNVKDKTIPNLIINKFIHITKGRHRSWQTHSLDIMIISMVIVYASIIKSYEIELLTQVNKEIAMIIVTGFYCGWISHMQADMMTSEGVRLFCWNSKLKIKIVPKKIGKLKFNTGNEWERFVYRTVRKIDTVLGIYVLIYPYFTIGQMADLVLKVIGKGK